MTSPVAGVGANDDGEAGSLVDVCLWGVVNILCKWIANILVRCSTWVHTSSMISPTLVKS